MVIITRDDLQRRFHGLVIFFLFITLLLVGPRFAFTISCFPSAMVAHISRDSLPLGSDARLLHLNDPSCGVNYLTKKSVIIKAPLKGCGTVRR